MNEKNLNLYSCLTEFVNYLQIKNKAPNTLKDYYSLTLKLIKYLSEKNINLHDLKITDIEKFLAKIKNGVSNNTYSKFIVIVRVFLKFLYCREYIKKDLCFEIEPVKKIAPAERQILKENEIDMIIKHLKTRPAKQIINLRDMIIFYFGINCGLRRQEIINLNASDVCFDEETAAYYIKIIRSKGGKSRTVYISEKLYSLIYSYKKQKRIYSGALIRGSQGRRITKQAIQKAITEIYSDTGIKREGLCFHSLRHTYAMRQKSRGTDMFTISKLMGHSRVDVTMGYFHVNKSDFIKAIL